MLFRKLRSAPPFVALSAGAIDPVMVLRPTRTTDREPFETTPFAALSLTSLSIAFRATGAEIPLAAEPIPQFPPVPFELFVPTELAAIPQPLSSIWLRRIAARATPLLLPTDAITPAESLSWICVLCTISFDRPLVDTEAIPHPVNPYTSLSRTFTL